MAREMSTGQQGEAQGHQPDDTTPSTQSIPAILRSYARVVSFTAHAEHLERAAELIEALQRRLKDEAASTDHPQERS